MSDPRDFRLYVPRVARALGLRLSRTRAPSDARSRIYQALRHAAEVDTPTLRGQITRAAAEVRPAAQRAYHMANLLFGYAWMVSPDSPAAGELRQLFRTYYTQAEAENKALWEFLRDDVRGRALSSNKLVREMAADVRGDDAAGQDDGAVVSNPNHPPDVRLRASGRLLAKAGAGQLGVVIEYLRELRTTRNSKDLKRAWKWLYDALKSYGRRAEVASALRDGFVLHAHDHEFSGFLLDLAAVANLGAAAVLAQAARTAAHGDAPAYSRLLKHMAVQYDSVTAATALRDLVLDPVQPAGAGELFIAAANDLSDKSSPPPALKEVFASAAVTFREHAGLVMRAELISRALDKWGQEVTEEEMVRHLTGVEPLKVARLRKCGRQGFRVVQRFARDTTARMDDRLRAVHAATVIRTPFLRQLTVDLLWDLYRGDPNERVRAAALLGLAEKEPDLTDAERERLHAERTAASPGTELRQAFDDPKVSEWMYITGLPAVPGDSPNVP